MSGGSDIDLIKLRQDLRAVEKAVRKLNSAVGISSIEVESRVLNGWRQALDSAGSVIPTDTVDTYDFGAQIDIPALTLYSGSRIQIDAALECYVQNFPWSFALQIDGNGDKFAVADDVSFTGTGPDTVVISVRFVGSVRASGGDLTIIPDSVVAWQWKAGGASVPSGTAINTDFSGAGSFDGNAILSITPEIVLAGCTAGDTIQIRTLDVLVLDPGSSGAS